MRAVAECIDDREHGITLTPWGLTDGEARRLWVSVLRQAVEDIWGYAARYGGNVAYPTDRNRERLRAERLMARNNARMWMIVESGDPGGFGYVCDHLGFDPARVRGVTLAGPPDDYAGNDKFWLREREGRKWASA